MPKKSRRGSRKSKNRSKNKSKRKTLRSPRKVLPMVPTLARQNAFNSGVYDFQHQPIDLKRALKFP